MNARLIDRIMNSSLYLALGLIFAAGVDLGGFVLTNQFLAAGLSLLLLNAAWELYYGRNVLGYTWKGWGNKKTSPPYEAYRDEDGHIFLISSDQRT